MEFIQTANHQLYFLEKKTHPNYLNKNQEQSLANKQIDKQTSGFSMKVHP